MISMYYRDAIGAIICYDLTDERSFNAVQYWVNEMIQNTNYESGGFVMALAGNKCDMPAESQRISSKASLEFAKKHQMSWSEVSAKTGMGVAEMFKAIAEKAYAIKMKQQAE